MNLRAIVLDGDGVDVDIHILQSSEATRDDPRASNDCIERDDFLIEGILEPGRYTIVIDSFVRRGSPQEGQYDVIFASCDIGDDDCDEILSSR